MTRVLLYAVYEFWCCVFESLCTRYDCSATS